MRESANVLRLTGRDRDAVFDPIVRRLAAKCEKARFCARVKSKQQPVVTTDKFTPRYRGRARVALRAPSRKCVRADRQHRLNILLSIWKSRGFPGGWTGIAKNSFVGKHAAMMVAYLPANKSKPRRVAAQGPLCPCATNTPANARQDRRFVQAALRACGSFE
jgi:hypothetical protein